jgi:hypothetical protein
MKIYSVDPDATREKTSIRYALASGYSFKMDEEDGSCEITNPDQEIYHVHHFKCDCPDAIGRNGGSYELPDGRQVCKHVLWVSQLAPCPNCQGFMMLRQESWKFYHCRTPGCYTMIPFQRIKEDRQLAYRLTEQEADIEKVINYAEPVEGDLAARALQASHAIFGH